MYVHIYNILTFNKTVHNYILTSIKEKSEAFHQTLSRGNICSERANLEIKHTPFEALRQISRNSSHGLLISDRLLDLISSSLTRQENFNVEVLRTFNCQPVLAFIRIRPHRARLRRQDM